MTEKTLGVDNKMDVKIPVPLKFLNNFRRTLEMPFINCEINLILTWSTDCVISSATAETKLKITDTNFMFQLQLYQLKIMQNHCNN